MKALDIMRKAKIGAKKTSAVYPFVSSFLSQFFYIPKDVKFKDSDFFELDEAINEQITQAKDVTKFLIRKNELLTSFAISKTEASDLSIQEADDIRKAIDVDDEYSIIFDGYKEIGKDKKATKKIHDKLEFQNILKAYRYVDTHPLSAKNLNMAEIKKLHSLLTSQMDVFIGKLQGFESYHAGVLRAKDNVFVADYKPVVAKDISAEFSELVKQLKDGSDKQNLLALNIFNIALYSLHPFKNGNKRLCRLLEHALLKDIGINKNNFYSHIYYYYVELERFYEKLYQSLKTKNFTHMINFSREALFFSQLSVFKMSLEQKRKDAIELFFMSNMGKSKDGYTEKMLKLFVKNKSVQFKDILKKPLDTRKGGKPIPQRTLINGLEFCISKGILTKIQKGKNTFYSLNVDAYEESFIREMIFKHLDNGDMDFIPRRFRQSCFHSFETPEKALFLRETSGIKNPPRVGGI